jgi:hypothetical protein
MTVAPVGALHRSLRVGAPLAWITNVVIFPT